MGVEAGHNPGREGASTYELYTDISVLSHNRVLRVASAPRLGSSLMVRDHEKGMLKSGGKIEVARFGCERVGGVTRVGKEPLRWMAGAVCDAFWSNRS